MRRTTTLLAAGLIVMIGIAGCEGSDPPNGGVLGEVSVVTADGFDSPLDAVASPDY